MTQKQRRRMERRIARFWAKVDRSATDSCWLWTGTVSGRGYGRVRWPGRGRSPLRAHRVAYELAFGPIPPGLYVLHRCDVPRCVKTEPDARFPSGHLWLGTAQDNTDDMIAKGRARFNVPHRDPLPLTGFFEPRGSKLYTDLALEVGGA